MKVFNPYTDILPVIHLNINSMKFYELFIDGEKINFLCYPSKRVMKRYLKMAYGIDLRTDKRVIKNYKEFTTRLVYKIGNRKIYSRKNLIA
ncbi:MAG: hypothetical protein AABY22_24805 [Nanoarchaeota archaeon]